MRHAACYTRHLLGCLGIARLNASHLPTVSPRRPAEKFVEEEEEEEDVVAAGESLNARFWILFARRRLSCCFAVSC